MKGSGEMDKDNRNLVGKWCVFNTIDTKYSEYSGKKVKVKRILNDNEYDFENVGTMYEVILENTNNTGNFDAYADELELA
jgi:hypothetical protein